MNRRNRIFKILGVSASIAVLLLSAPAHSGSIIRDTEIERTIEIYATPLLRAAGLNREAVHFHLINDSQVNAFVAGGQRIFLTTGLMRATKGPNQLLGVMAHEMGHISGGHLARLHGALAKAGDTALVTQLLGVALGLLSGNPGVAAAVGGGGTQVAERSFLSFSRTQEQSADQAAVRYMDHAGLSSRGMLEFLEYLQGQELLVTLNQDPYLQTHPLTRDRIAFVENHVAKSKYSDRKPPEAILRLHARMVAKIDAFVDAPQITLRKYAPTPDDSEIKRYARAIAHYRNANLEEAVPLVDGLIRDFPKNPFYIELKGQMLFENGRIDEARDAYEKSVRILPTAPLLRVSLAHVMLESGQEKFLPDARGHLQQAVRTDRYISLAWRLLATVHGRAGDLGLSAWAQAEYNLLLGRKRDARGQAQRAMRLLKEGEPAWLRAQDIVVQTEPRQN